MRSKPFFQHQLIRHYIYIHWSVFLLHKNFYMLVFNIVWVKCWLYVKRRGISSAIFPNQGILVIPPNFLCGPSYAICALRNFLCNSKEDFIDTINVKRYFRESYNMLSSFQNYIHTDINLKILTTHCSFKMSSGNIL